MRLTPSIPAEISLDFIPARRHPNVIGWVLLLAGLIASIAVVIEYLDLGESLGKAQSQLNRETRHFEHTRDRELAKRNEKVPEAELRQAAALAQELRAEGLRMLGEIEAASDADISLLSLQQGSGKPVVKLSGEARSLEAALAFARRLAQRPMIMNARVESFEFKQSGAVEIVSFTLSASWRPQS